MNAEKLTNKEIMQVIFDGLSRGDGRPFRKYLADDARWIMTGSTAWSRTYEGRRAVLGELMGPLFAQFADRYTNRARRFIAEGEFVVVESRGQVTTKAGEAYNNTYCWVCRLADGRLCEVTEYLDTQLVATALAPPGAR